MEKIKRKRTAFLIISVVTAGILSLALKSPPLDEQFINLAVKQNLSYLVLDNESTETKAILLDYADNPQLVLTAWLALKKYPQTAEPVFSLYAQDPDFKKGLLQFGDGVIPVIEYFLKNEVVSLTAQATVTQVWQNLQNAIATPESTQNTLAELTSQQRGGYAIHFINQEGYNFLGQFAIDPQGHAQWIQSDRATKALANLFTGGIRELEKKYKTAETITQSDIFWAGVDTLAIASSLKLLKASRAMSSTHAVAHLEQPVSLVKKISVFSTQLITNDTLQGLLKHSDIATTIYTAIAHPSLINSMLDEFAQQLGIHPILLKMSAWTITLLIALYPLFSTLILIVKPIMRGVNSIQQIFQSS